MRRGDGVSKRRSSAALLPPALAMQRHRSDFLAVNALWMVGHVQSVLACEIRLQRLNTEDFFLALHHDVHPDVIEVVNQRTGAFGAQGPLVAFQADDRPGLQEVDGRRARSVQLASTALWPASGDAIILNEDAADQRSRVDPPLPRPRHVGFRSTHCQVVDDAVLQWQELIHSRDLSELLAFRVRLQGHFDQGASDADGSRLCSVLLCCLAGMLALSEAKSGFQSSERDRIVDGFGKCSTELIRLANCCWAALDLKHASTSRSLAAARPICQQLVAEGEGEDLEKFRRHVEACFSVHGRPRRPRTGWSARRRCEIAGCKSVAARMVWRDDGHGPAGFRCEGHGGRSPCAVPGCKRASTSIVTRDDILGPAGYRCNLHGARRCTVSGCWREAKCNAAADDLAPAGRRCPKHSPVWPRAAQAATKVA